MHTDSLVKECQEAGERIKEKSRVGRFIRYPIHCLLLRVGVHVYPLTRGLNAH